MNQEDKKFNIPTIPLGENRTLFVPLNQEGEPCIALGFFVVEEGKLEGKTIGIQEVQDHLDDAVPVVALRFKTKKSITDVIKFLRFYRDNLYKKITSATAGEVQDETKDD